jgi:hypothetical protein
MVTGHLLRSSESDVTGQRRAAVVVLSPRWGWSRVSADESMWETAFRYEKTAIVRNIQRNKADYDGTNVAASRTTA